MNNCFADAPRKEGGQNPFLGVLSALVRQIEAGSISDKTEKDMITVAGYYAKRNKLSFTPTLHGVLVMVAEADRMHRLHMEAMARREREEFDPTLTGYDLATGHEA